MTEEVRATAKPKERRTKLQFYAGFGVVFILLILVASAWTIIRTRNGAEAFLADDAALIVLENKGLTTMVGDLEIPILPNAGLDTAGQSGAPVGSVVHLVSGVSPIDVKTWYQSTLIGLGFTIENEQNDENGNLSFVATSVENQQIAFRVWPTDDGQTAFALGLLNGNNGMPEATIAESTDIVPETTKNEMVSLVPSDDAGNLTPLTDQMSSQPTAQLPEGNNGPDVSKTEVETIAADPDTMNGETTDTDNAKAVTEQVAVLSSEVVMQAVPEASAPLTKTKVQTNVIQIAHGGAALAQVFKTNSIKDTAVSTAQPISKTEAAAIDPAQAGRTALPPTAASLSSWYHQISLMTSVTPTTTYAGMFNRLTYQLAITGSGSAKLAVTLPPEVLVEPAKLPPGTSFDDVNNILVWRVDLDVVSPYQLSFEAITDLLSIPGDLVFKTIAYPDSATEQPTIEVTEVVLRPFKRAVDDIMSEEDPILEAERN
jgi:hypothetical protein